MYKVALDSKFYTKLYFAFLYFFTFIYCTAPLSDVKEDLEEASDTNKLSSLQIMYDKAIESINNG